MAAFDPFAVSAEPVPDDVTDVGDVTWQRGLGVVGVLLYVETVPGYVRKLPVLEQITIRPNGMSRGIYFT